MRDFNFESWNLAINSPDGILFKETGVLLEYDELVWRYYKKRVIMFLGK
jgi:hypothetical protein